MVWKILFPMLDKVRAETRSASTLETGGAGLGATNIMVHHSRNTELKQWAETTVRTLSGVVKIFNAQRNILLTLGMYSRYPFIFFVLIHFLQTTSALVGRIYWPI
jgi:hypothetical protein